jgi:adenylate cyclase
MTSQPESRLSRLWQEIKRRKVVRVILAYLVVGWALIQVADATLQPLHLPDWAGTLVIWLVGLGFPVAVILAWVLDVTPQGIQVTKSASGLRPPDASLAVLPFVNLSGDEDNEYFSDGLSEELLNLLTRLRSLRVCSRTSSFALKGKALDMPTIAKQLNVRHVLEGSVRRVGDRVRITAQFIDARDDRHLWSENYDRRLQDIFAVQDEIAAHIVEALKLTLTADEQQAIHSTTDDVKALDYYLRGREMFHRTEAGHLQKSREMFEAAIRLDPSYALAWAGLTYVFVDTYWYHQKEPSWIQRAQDASRKAVEFAPHLAEAHAARGYAFFVDDHFDAAEAEFLKAMEINPRLFEPVHFYAQMARNLGQYGKAAKLFVHAANVRPEDYQALSIASAMYEMTGDIERHREALTESLERIQRALELNPADTRALSLGANAYVKLGETAMAREWIHRARQIDPDASGVLYNGACVYALTGDPDTAIDLLEQAAAKGARNKRVYENDKDFESIRDHPRFRALLDQM